jgi:hypothetical protein
MALKRKSLECWTSVFCDVWKRDKKKNFVVESHILHLQIFSSVGWVLVKNRTILMALHIPIGELLTEQKAFLTWKIIEQPFVPLQIGTHHKHF